MKRFLIFLFIVAALTIPSMVKGATQQEIENYVIQKSLEAGFVKPGFPVGVIQVESRLGRVPYRTGRIGSYYHPGGVHFDFLKKWNLNNWKTVVDVAVGTLHKRMIKFKGNKVKVLKSYNTTGYTNAYANQIWLIEKQYNEGARYGIVLKGRTFEVAKVGKRENR
jgi:hypothetical protein